MFPKIRANQIRITEYNRNQTNTLTLWLPNNLSHNVPAHLKVYLIKFIESILECRSVKTIFCYHYRLFERKSLGQHIFPCVTLSFLLSFVAFFSSSYQIVRYGGNVTNLKVISFFFSLFLNKIDNHYLSCLQLFLWYVKIRLMRFVIMIMIQKYQDRSRHKWQLAKGKWNEKRKTVRDKTDFLLSQTEFIYFFTAHHCSMLNEWFLFHTLLLSIFVSLCVSVCLLSLFHVLFTHFFGGTEISTSRKKRH